MIADLDHTEAELRSPPRLVLDEIELVDERPDRRLGALEEVDLATPGRQVRRHLGLVRLIVGDPSDGGEGLQRLAVGVDGLRRVEDDPVTPGHRAQHVRLAVIGLCEAALHATLDVVTADGIDPVGHDRTLSPIADRTGTLRKPLWITSGALASDAMSDAALTADGQARPRREIG